MRRFGRSLPRLAVTAAGLCALPLFGCDTPAAGLTEVEAPLSDLEVLLAGAPDQAKLPDEPKSDATYPAQFDLSALQSPVRDQASRGVCSIFSTVALMEHLYIKEGTLQKPDFSEQFLQWSSKAELGAFPTTEGSNADRNVEAINRFGIVDEQAWPYQRSRWSSSNDARCDGSKEQPVLCYTNGDPSDTVKAAQRWKLPPTRWVSARRQSIKAFMVQNRQAVVAGMTFFYQSWNHGGGGLPTSSASMRKGYILYPNAKDKEVAKAKPAGHSILIIGWDDNLELPIVDETGAQVTDKDGKVVTEKGFFLIKNSWGTGSFGVENPFGPGYGWLSMRYVEEYANIVGSDVPRLDLGPEVCDDGQDNNMNRLVDCEDIDTCAKHPACSTAAKVVEGRPGRVIPDGDPAGLAAQLTVDTAGELTEAWVEVDVSHSFIRDLTLTVELPSGRRVTLYDRNDNAGRDLRRRFLLPNLIGEQAQGTWHLTVVDAAKGDTGKLNRWAIGTTVSVAPLVEVCDDGKDNDGNGQTDCVDAACVTAAACAGEIRMLGAISEHDSLPIPDQDPRGVASPLVIDEDGSIVGATVEVEITHPYRGDLTVTLTGPDGTVAVLSDKAGGRVANLRQTFTTNAFDGKRAKGTWTLRAVDNFSGDTGELDIWMLDLNVR